MASQGFKKFLHMIGFGDGDVPEEDVRGGYSQQPTRVNSANPYRQSDAQPRSGAASRPQQAPNTEYRTEYRSEYRAPETPRYGGSVSSAEGVRMQVLQPRSLDDTRVAIDTLCQGQSIVVNLERLDASQATRVLDYIAGATYALGGDIRKVSKGIFLVAPRGVDITGNINGSFAEGVRNAETR